MMLARLSCLIFGSFCGLFLDFFWRTLSKMVWLRDGKLQTTGVEGGWLFFDCFVGLPDDLVGELVTRGYLKAFESIFEETLAGCFEMADEVETVLLLKAGTSSPDDFIFDAAIHLQIGQTDVESFEQSLLKAFDEPNLIEAVRHPHVVHAGHIDEEQSPKLFRSIAESLAVLNRSFEQHFTDKMTSRQLDDA